MSDRIPTELHQIESSGLVSQTQLRVAIDRLALDKKKVTVESILKHLWTEGIISKWQALQLNAGRFKGFFLRHYIILKLSKSGKNTHLAEAIDSVNGKFVLLKVSRLEKPFVEELCYLGVRIEEGLPLLSDDAKLERTR